MEWWEFGGVPFWRLCECCLVRCRRAGGGRWGEWRDFCWRWWWVECAELVRRWKLGAVVDVFGFPRSAVTLEGCAWAGDRDLVRRRAPEVVAAPTTPDAVIVKQGK